MRKIHAPYIAAILLLAAFLRAWISDFTLILLDYDAFYHARIADSIYHNHHIPTWDALELGGIPHYYPPGYHILIVLGKYILPGQSTIAIGSILTVFFGVITTLFVYLIGRRFSENVGLVSALLYALTPMMVLRSGLWARPTGLSMFFMVIMIFLFLRIAEKRDRRDAAIALVVSTVYAFTHSSVLLALLLIFAVSIIAGNTYATKTFFKITLFLTIAGGLYYSRALPFLNFSISQSGEYMPLTRPLLELYTFGFWQNLAEAFLYMGLFSLAIFPLILHGIYEMTKRKKQLGLISFFSILLIFFKANMFLLLNFTVCVAIAVSVFRITKIGKAPAAAILLLTVIGMDLVLLQMVHGEKKRPYVGAVEEVLTNAPLTSENVVLPSDPIAGHAIPYFSPAATFISDLTDTKQFDKNLEVFNRLKHDKIDTEEAMDLLVENDIDRLLIIGDPFPFMKDSKQDFVLIRKINKNGVNASLYRLK
jgi:4-amino-4-deoxy-L-arabinose transferase-like glycosyltransferase